jgi:hypothetical protein
MKNTSISTHITSILTGAAGVIALVHPGFQLPPFVQGLTVSISALVVTVLQMRHLTFKQALLQTEKFAQAATATVAAPVAPATVAPVAPQGPQA